MQVLDKAVEKFDELGQPGVAETRAAKRINRGRAAGVVALSSLGLAGFGLFLGGLRNGGIHEGILEVGRGITAPLRNADGNWDMPFIDIRNRDLGVSLDFGNSTDTESPAASGVEACPTSVIAYELQPGDFVSTAVNRVNNDFLPQLDSQAELDPLWANYFSADNNGADPNNPGVAAGDIVNIRQLESIDNCDIR